jgi:hypothetical protein
MCRWLAPTIPPTAGDHNFGSLIMLAVTAAAFLLVAWVATRGLFFFLQESPRDCGGDNLIYTLVCEVQDVQNSLARRITAWRSAYLPPSMELGDFVSSAFVGLLWSVAGTSVAFGYECRTFPRGAVLMARLRKGDDVLSRTA